ncbi:MAG TPA: hypothetical protein VIO33_09330 [Burkholderiaceae bacterium]
MQRLLIAFALAGLASIVGAQPADAAEANRSLYDGQALALAGIAAIVFLAVRRRRP